MQICPAWANAASVTRVAASSRSAERSITTAALPPSSSVTRFVPAAARNAHPTAGLPVNETAAGRRSSTRRAPSSGSSPTTTLTAPGGSPHASRIAPRSSPVTGIFSLGLSTTALPAANAGPTLCTARFSGKLNGVIATTTPRGWRRTVANRPAPAGAPSSAGAVPWRRVASSALAVEGADRALDLAARVPDGLAALLADRAREVVGPGAHGGGGAVQRLGARERGQRGHGGRGRGRRRERGLEVGGARDGDAGDDRSSTGRARRGSAASPPARRRCGAGAGGRAKAIDPS